MYTKTRSINHKSLEIYIYIYINWNRSFKIEGRRVTRQSFDRGWKEQREESDPIPVSRGDTRCRSSKRPQPLLNQYLVYIVAWNRTLATDTRHRYQAANKVIKTVHPLLIYRFGKMEGFDRSSSFPRLFL